MNETAELFFLERVANKLVEEYGANLYKTTIVLPSNRAKSYFSKYLFDIAGKPILLPNLVQMSQWVQQLSGYTTANKMSLILLVYEAYTNVVKNPEPFEIFTKWGITALDDFNQIDSSLVQSSELFKNLRDIKDIESWSFDSDELAESQIQFENFWLQLGEVYYEFIRLQEERKQFSYARINRLMAENKIASCEDEVVIVGLSSFSIAEEKWLNDLNKKGNIHFEFDADCYYVNNPQHEAGIFFRKWEKAGHSFSKSNDFEKFKREITISKVVTPLASAFAAAKLVNEMSPQEREGCAVVLTQPQLLRPFLNALNIQTPINVALGYPIDQTSVYRSTKMLVKIWHRLSVNLTKGIYYKDLLMWLSQPDLKLLFKEELLAKINSTISYKRWIYIRDKEWLQLISEFPETQFFFELFTSHNFDFKQALNRLDSWLNSLSESKEFDDLSVEAIFRMQNTVIKMQEHADQNSFLNAVENIDLLFQHYTASEEVTFQGEPLQGIQILSPQETRGVNFRNCIIVGANDDVFPGSGRINSLIPFDLRIPFKLPLPQDKEGAVAYTFYRLIQRAEKTRLIYYTLSSDYKSTEPSRYILQIKHELADKKWNTVLVEEDFIHENQMTEKAETIIQANDFSKERIRKLLENGISPSALNKFLACPLDFYYRYVIGLGELEELEENMEAATLGIVVHKVMEVFFKEFEQKEVNAAILKSFIPRIDHELDKAITEKYTKGNELSGFDIITKGVAKKMIENVINYDIDYLTEKNIKTKVEGVEVPLQAPLPLDKIGRKEKVLLKGLADRIDLEVGKFKIIDFKTGKVEDKHVTFSDSDERWVTSEKTKLVQLLAYTYMWFKGGHAPENITATLFGLKQARKGYFPLKRGKDTAVMNAQDMQRFETEVMDVIVEMLEISEFKHNEEAKYCEFCNQ